mmetsp:Transcript_50992/g.127982  ORF Transcript_50992/g.127982 Transcript_50992/m.127982 type:complete len:210 (-) Transcript_50992:187-816(-)
MPTGQTRSSRTCWSTTSSGQKRSTPTHRTSSPPSCRWTRLNAPISRRSKATPSSRACSGTRCLRGPPRSSRSSPAWTTRPTLTLARRTGRSTRVRRTGRKLPRGAWMRRLAHRRAAPLSLTGSDSSTGPTSSQRTCRCSRSTARAACCRPAMVTYAAWRRNRSRQTPTHRYHSPLKPHHRRLDGGVWRCSGITRGARQEVKTKCRGMQK